MINFDDLCDQLNRTVKLSLDSGEAETLEVAMRIFQSYRLQIVLGPDVEHDASLQIAALTAVNCAARTFLGGVVVVGASGVLKVCLLPFSGVSDALQGLGGRIANTVDPHMPTILVGDATSEGIEPLAIRAIVDGWSGGVVRANASITGDCHHIVAPAGVLAGAIAVSEVFQRLRGNAMACRRAIGLNLWRPEQDWRSGEQGPTVTRLPSAAWLVGLGNLGQAYLWTLGLLPYGSDAAELVLQDFDILAPSNMSTSLLTTGDIVGLRKTRAIAAWAERRGFKTTVVERNFAANFHINDREPSVALIGVDNALARHSIEDAGFARVIEAGLGRGPQDYLGFNIHTFPGSAAARTIWAEPGLTDVELTQPAYRALLEESGDRCGTVRLAGRSIGAPFVGAAAGAMVISELLRLVMGDHHYELVTCHMRDLASRNVVHGKTWDAFNPGGVPSKE